ncbi:unnamed protein product, partial [Closterium sp. NIES-54]
LGAIDPAKPQLRTEELHPLAVDGIPRHCGLCNATAALQSAIAEMLAKEGELGCKLSITIDMWTAPNNKAWLVVTGHWIDENFQLRTMVLEFAEMLGRHGRWGSTHDMVERAGVLQNPITVFFAQTQTDKKKVESLRLTDADWETLQAVKTFLSPFAKVSKAAEGAAYPTVSMVVSYYNGLIDAMESRLAKGPSPTLQPMIVAALSHLKKYAYITSNEYWIATFLDPSMKAAWFDDAHWEKLHPETERRVRPRPGDKEEDDDDAQFLPSRRRLAARLSASQQAGAGGMVQDDEVSSATNMHTLRRMARDYLAIPATSASSEGRRPRGVAPPEFAIEGEGAEEGDEEEEEEGVEADDTAGGEDAVVGSSSAVAP